MFHGTIISQWEKFNDEPFLVITEESYYKIIKKYIEKK